MAAFDPDDAGLAMLVQLELELAEHAAADLPSTLTAENAVSLRSTEPSSSHGVCEPEPSSSAQSPPLLDSQQPRLLAAFAAGSRDVVPTNQGLRGEVFDGCRQQPTQCSKADQMNRGSRRNLDAGKTERAATLIRDQNQQHASRVVKVSQAALRGWMHARTDGSWPCK